MTGGTGLLGAALLETAPDGVDVLATAHRNRPPLVWHDRFYEMDVRDAAVVDRVMETVRPEIVIHAASIGGVEEAERHPELVAEVNVRGTQHVAQACASVGASLVFISSNAVFDGSQAPYAEEAPLRAVNRYGAFKIEAEAWIRTRCRVPYAIIRPILMYGWPLPGGRQNVVTRWLADLEQGRPIEVDGDLYSKPLLAINGAEAIWACVMGRRSGIYHVAGADRLSLLEFARQTARVFECDDRLVRPASERFLSQFASRPRDTSYVTTKMERELGVRPIGTLEGLVIMRRSRITQPEMPRCVS
jgi:dTDP-4-dehydrorhamnose reductase